MEERSLKLYKNFVKPVSDNILVGTFHKYVWVKDSKMLAYKHEASSNGWRKCKEVNIQ